VKSKLKLILKDLNRGEIELIYFNFYDLEGF